ISTMTARKNRISNEETYTHFHVFQIHGLQGKYRNRAHQINLDIIRNDEIGFMKIYGLINEFEMHQR
ncbi:unnamed protein product, partial [Rotaria magnacalcarata]